MGSPNGCHVISPPIRMIVQFIALVLLSLTALKSNTLTGAELLAHRAINGEKLDPLDHSKIYALRVDLVHRDSLLSPIGAGNVTLAERLQRAVQRSKDRIQKLLTVTGTLPDSTDSSVDASTDIEVAVNVGEGEFLVTLGIGTPPLSYCGILDTGSDLVWAQCNPCTYCYSQPTPIYDPSKSSTYSKVPCQSSLCKALTTHDCNPDCEYTYSYGDFSLTSGILSFESFTLKSTSIPHIAFGCGRVNEGRGLNQAAGIVGLGRGPLSFVSQLGSYADNKFSYCLMPITDSPSKKSPLIFGEGAALNAEGVKTTPFIKNRKYPIYYYLSLEGISVGGTLLNIPPGTFDIRSDGSGGVIIDSGTTVTYLEKAGYNSLRNALVASIDLPKGDAAAIGLDLCYELPSGNSHPDIPSLTFHFKGADLDLPRDNYFMHLEKSGLLCLAVLPSSGMSILGNVQQQNFHIFYDNVNNQLSFVPATCDAL